MWQLATSLPREFVHLTPFAGFVLGVVLVHIKTIDLEYRKENNLYQKKYLYGVIIFIIIFAVFTILLSIFSNQIIPRVF